PGPVFHTIVSIKNDGHYFCRAGGNRPDGLNEPVTFAGRSDYADSSTTGPYIHKQRPPGQKQCEHYP
nr:hypothetical protein [Escherichia coli]MDN1076657.1 hypothetical protein [Escherichia coli]